MGIFGKKKDLSTGFEDLAFEEESASEEGNDTPFGFADSGEKSAPGSSKYSIEQAIDLVSSLREHNISSTVIAGIVKKTLESVNIHFPDIIADAKRRESEIKSSTEQKETEIQQMLENLDNLKQEKVKLQKDLEETIDAREFLQLAVDEEPETPEEPLKPLVVDSAEAGLDEADKDDVAEDGKPEDQAANG